MNNYFLKVKEVLIMDNANKKFEYKVKYGINLYMG